MEGEVCETLPNPIPDPEAWRTVASYRTVAVVGMSTQPEKPAHYVPKYLQEQGYTVIPVNPRAAGTTLLGQRVYSHLRGIPQPVDVVLVFRPPKEVPAIVEEAISIGAKVVWMQEGIVSHQAAQRAREAGLQVVMDKCMMKVHQAMRQTQG